MPTMPGEVLCNLPYSNTTNIQYLCFQNFRQLQKDHNMEVGDDSVPMLTNQYNVCHVNWYSNQKIHECQTISCSSDQDVVWVDEGPQLNLSLTWNLLISLPVLKWNSSFVDSNVVYSVVLVHKCLQSSVFWKLSLLLLTSMLFIVLLSSGSPLIWLLTIFTHNLLMH